MRKTASGEGEIGGCLFGLICFGLLVWFVVYNCQPSVIKQREHDEYVRCLPRVVQENDGIRLWELNANCNGNGEAIYYSTKSVNWTTRESCGRHCTKTLQHIIPSPP